MEQATAPAYRAENIAIKKRITKRAGNKEMKSNMGEIVQGEVIVQASVALVKKLKTSISGTRDSAD
jgi:hypothetical protein